MLNKINYAVTFSNGQTLAAEYEFDKGSYLVTGANGKGKSLLLELYAFSLFGSSALRGVATDYGKMLVEVTTTIRGQVYDIKRTKSTAKIFKDGEQIVDGTKPVNEWVMRNLGFNYSVFRVAHWCAQGDIQTLAAMKPTERKEMINSVTGLAQMDVLVDAIHTRGRVAKAEITGLEEGLVTPNAPVKPESDLDQALETIEKVEAERERFTELSSVAQPTEPTKPADPVKPNKATPPSQKVLTAAKPDPVSLPEELAGMDDEAIQAAFESNLVEIPKLKKLEAQYDRLQRAVKDVPPCDELALSSDELEALWDGWEQRQVLNRLKQSTTTVCPECDHEFHLDYMEIQRLEALDLPEQAPSLSLAQHDKLLKQLETNELFGQVANDFDADLLAQLETQQATIKEYMAQVHQYDKAVIAYNVAAADVVDWNKAEEERYQRELEKDEQSYQTLLSQFDAQIQRYEKRMAEYNEALRVYEEAKAELDTISEQYEGSPMRAFRQVIAQAQETVSEHNVFKSQMQRYEQDVVAHNKTLAKIDELQGKVTDYNNARKAIAEVKKRVQSYVVPSLNKVASYLITEMTGGKHTQIELTEDFELLVDGDPLRTLSGSGKDIANIALRIALGRILTHSVLPVMMLDEVDSAMDDERAEYTWDCIQKITPEIGQVLQASHKELVADNRLEVA